MRIPTLSKNDHYRYLYLLYPVASGQGFGCLGRFLLLPTIPITKVYEGRPCASGTLEYIAIGTQGGWTLDAQRQCKEPMALKSWTAILEGLPLNWFGLDELAMYSSPAR